MKKREAMAVGEIIKQAIDATGHRNDFDRQRACYVWPEIVGPAINRLTTRRWVDGDTLHVCLASAPLKQDLAFHKEKLIELINKMTGSDAIHDIRIH